MALWCGYINTLLQQKQLPALSADAWPVLFRQAVRYSGDQGSLPLCPQWLTQQLAEAALYAENDTISANALEATECPKLAAKLSCRTDAR